MAKYYYSKYTTNTVKTYIENDWASGVPGFFNENFYFRPYYTFNTSTGKYDFSGIPVTLNSTNAVDGSLTGYATLAVFNGIEGIFVLDGPGTYVKGGKYSFTCKYNDYSTTTTSSYVRGSYITDVVAENGTYPTNGMHTDGFWYVRGSLANSVPTIDGADSNLGDKNLGFSILYKVNDVDVSDSLIVTEKLNNSIIRAINGAPRNQDLEIEINNETLFSLPLNSENTIEIKVDDQKGGIAYRRYTFRRTNTAPIISDQDKDLGQRTEPFEVDFSVTDNEGNAITVKIYLNGIKKEEYQVEDGATNTFTISATDWLKLPIGQHSIKIEAIDEHGATAIRNYTFTRYDDKIQFTFKSVIETDIAATKILVTPTWIIPQGATAKVEVCNNGYDEVPAWEDITSQVSTGKHYIFTNVTKTADKWGIDIRFTIEKGNSTEECVIHGFGGAFE